MRFGPHTITVLRAAEVAGDYGNRTVADWGNPTETTVEGCSVQPAPSTEFTVDRDTFITRWQVFAPIEADVRPTDRIQWGNAIYEVDGDVLRWEFGALSHLVINLRRSEDA
jgi:hypothetical protein